MKMNLWLFNQQYLRLLKFVIEDNPKRLPYARSVDLY